MVALTDVTLTAGLGTGGTGTVSTLDKFNGTAGTPTAQVLTVQGVASGTAQPVSIATAPVLVAGAAVIGKVGIDQTTPGTTNLVSIGTNGTVNPQTPANWGIGTSTQNSASVANGILNLGQFNTTPTTITTGNTSPLQMDNAGNLLVNIKAGAAAGGTSSSYGAAFPASGTAIGFSDGTNLTAGTIKAASTAAAAADKAIVVAVSPNNYDFSSGTGGSKTQRVIIDSSQFSTLGATTKSASTSVARATDDTVGFTVTQNASSTITIPSAVQYTVGDLVANSATAGSVNNLQFTTLARQSGSSGVIVGAQIEKSTTSVTSAAFRLHLFNTAPTYVTNGDNSPISGNVVASAKGYLGYIDITTMIAFSDVSVGSGAPDNTRGGIPFVATAQIIYGLLEARGTYTPTNTETLKITLDALQD